MLRQLLSRLPDARWSITATTWQESLPGANCMVGLFWPTTMQLLAGAFVLDMGTAAAVQRRCSCSAQRTGNASTVPPPVDGEPV